jgi:putative flippase GtrA
MAEWGKLRDSMLARYSSSTEAVRYVQVGICNTVFGYLLFAGFTAWFESKVAHGYLLASLLSNLISITVAFLAYKWFVFRTKGNYLREWTKCLGVYGGSLVLGLFALPALVTVLRKLLGYEQQAPYIAGALLIGVNTVLSFLGHKHISFRGARQ